MTDPFAPLSTEPASLMIGSYCAWRISDSYDPALFTVKYVFLQGDVSTELDGVHDGTGWVFTATTAFTGTLVAGRAQLDLTVTRISDGQSAIVRTSTIRCFATQSERISHAQVMLDKIESVLQGRADSDVESYSIKSRSITKMSAKELTEWREYYLAELGREVNAVSGRRNTDNTVLVGFK